MYCSVLCTVYCVLCTVYCTVLHCTGLCGAVRCGAVLYCTVLYYYINLKKNLDDQLGMGEVELKLFI